MYKFRFQGIVYLKLKKWLAKILKNINKKNSPWGVLKLTRQKAAKSREHWTRKNELIIDLKGQSETENNKISILSIVDNILENTRK